MVYFETLIATDNVQNGAHPKGWIILEFAYGKVNNQQKTNRGFHHAWETNENRAILQKGNI